MKEVINIDYKDSGLTGKIIGCAMKVHSKTVDFNDEMISLIFLVDRIIWIF